MAAGLSNAGPGYSLGEVCRALCWGEIKVKGLGTGRIPGCKSHWGFMCLELVIVASFSKTLTAVIEYPTINPGFSPVRPSTIQNQNFLASCTIGHMGFVDEADCSPSAKNLKKGEQYLEPYNTGGPGPLSESASTLPLPLPFSP